MIGRYLVHGASRAGRNPDLPAGFVPKGEFGNARLYGDSAIRTLIAPSGRLAVFGELFSGATRADSRQLEIGGRVIESQQIVARFWGAYVAIEDHPDGSLCITRDPSGMMPCYFMTLDDMVTVSSDARVLASIAAQSMRVDESALGDHLLFPGHIGPRTCLDSIRELLPGQHLRLKDGHTEIGVAWSPWSVNQAAASDFTAFATQLRLGADMAFAAWSSLYPRSIATVSGGLDSSIVACAMAATGRTPELFTFFTGDKLGDERADARALARFLQTSLIEMDIDRQPIDVHRSTARHLPRPTGRVLAQTVHDQLVSLASNKPGTAIFTGFGGDNIFCFLQSAAPLVDRSLAEGTKALASMTYQDLVQLTGCTPTELFRHWLLRRFRHARNGPAYRWPRRELFLTDDLASRNAPVYPHPWLDAPARALPGHAAHVASLIRTHGFLDPFPREFEAANCAILMSQPIMEACLSVPTWHWCREGRNRAVARAAYSDLLSSRSLRRAQKGSPVGAYAREYERNIGQIRDMLMNGILARDRMIDTVEVESYLQLPGPMTDTRFLRILELVDVEAWAAEWSL